MDKEQRNEYMRQYNKRPEIIEKNKEIKKKYYLEHTQEKKEYDKKRREEKKELLAKQMKEYYETNKESIREYKKLWIKEKRKNDTLFKLKDNIRSLIRESIKRNGCKKLSKAESILGCSFEEFKSHLESKFESWMTWDNYGNPKDGIVAVNKSWDIDHIVPCSSAISEEELIELNHYTNLQPLCSHINRNVKRDKF